MSLNLKAGLLTAASKNGYTREDIIRMAVKNKKERINYLTTLMLEADGNMAVIGETITPKLSMNINKNA